MKGRQGSFPFIIDTRDRKEAESSIGREVAGRCREKGGGEDKEKKGEGRDIKMQDV